MKIAGILLFFSVAKGFYELPLQTLGFEIGDNVDLSNADMM